MPRMSSASSYEGLKQRTPRDRGQKYPSSASSYEGLKRRLSAWPIAAVDAVQQVPMRD